MSSTTNSSAARPCGSASFLSIFNVHINRAPRAQVVEMIYKPGEFLNAMRPRARSATSSMWIGFEDARIAAAPTSPCGRFPACLPGESSVCSSRGRLSRGARSLV